MNSRHLAVMALLSLVPGPAHADEVTIREQSRRDVPAQGFNALQVDNARGQVEVQPSTDGRIHVTALKIVRAPGQDRARQLASETLVEAESSEGRYVLRVRYPQRQNIQVHIWENVTLPRVEVRLSVQVPPGFGVHLNSASGDLFTDDIAGAQALKTASGDIDIQGARGPVEVTTASGDVAAADIRAARLSTVSGDLEIDSAAGSLIVSSTSGDVRIGSAADSLRIRTVSGDIRVDRAPRGLVVSTTSGSLVVGEVSGRLEAETVSGDVRAGFARPLRRVDVSTSNGDIVAKLHGPLGCTLTLRTTSGDIELDLPVRMKSVTRREVLGVLGDGSIPVTLHTVSGNISVSAGGE